MRHTWTSAARLPKQPCARRDWHRGIEKGVKTCKQRCLHGFGFYCVLTSKQRRNRNSNRSFFGSIFFHFTRSSHKSPCRSSFRATAHRPFARAGHSAGTWSRLYQCTGSVEWLGTYLGRCCATRSASTSATQKKRNGPPSARL